MKEYTYEITEKGYYILINGEKVIHQYEPFIPNKELSYEENAKAQIEELKEMDKQQKLEEEIENEKTEIEELQEQLNMSDYKIIKCTEYQLAGLEMPYNIEELHTERQALRDRINELQDKQEG